jgi:hypothetical protein
MLRSDISDSRSEGLDVFDNKVASNPENREKVYDEMFRQAAETLKTSTQGLILDAFFHRT